MATNNKTVIDILWEEMKELAIEQQQCFYELLPDCMAYKQDEHKYLIQNIGYAIYGVPTSQEDAGTSTDNDNCYSTETEKENADVTDTIDYNEKATNVIKAIYNQICKYTTEIDNTQPIYFGMIYNMIFCPKMHMRAKNKKEKNKVKKEIETDKEKKGEETMGQMPMVIPIPVFKIWTINQNKKDIAKKKDQTKLIKTELDYETWYIDTNARVYKNWIDYTTKNNLPKCTMVLPKNGCYQPDPNYPITEDYSTVWLEIIDSPACALKAKFFKTMDITSSILGFGTAGLCIASMFTPVGPIVVATSLAAGVTGTWQMGRSIQQLVDRSKHEESIHLLNKDAFPQWLGVTGSVLGLGTVGGTVALSAAITRGMTVNSAARIAYNGIQGGNLLVNGVGIIYQGYCMIDTFRNEGTVSYLDILSLSAHIMFFAGSVVRIQFAGDIIENTQGKIIDEYKKTLHNRRLRKQYNRFKRRATANNNSKMSVNAEIIRYIRNRNDLLSFATPSSTSNETPLNSQNTPLDSQNTPSNSQNTPSNSQNTPSNSQDMPLNSQNTPLNSQNTPLNSQNTSLWSFENGKLKVKGIILFDPMIYVMRLIKSGIFNACEQDNPSSSQTDANDSNVEYLMQVLSNLLTKLYTSPNCPKIQNLPTMPDFEPLLKEMSSMSINENFLDKLFAIAMKLMQRSKNMEDFLLNALSFVWWYCKDNLRQWGISTRRRMQSNSGSKILQAIITALFEAIDMMLDNLHVAFIKYMTAYLLLQHL